MFREQERDRSGSIAGIIEKNCPDLPVSSSEGGGPRAGVRTRSNAAGLSSQANSI